MRPKTKMAGRIQPRPLDGSMTRTHSSLKVFLCGLVLRFRGELRYLFDRIDYLSVRIADHHRP